MRIISQNSESLSPMSNDCVSDILYKRLTTVGQMSEFNFTLNCSPVVHPSLLAIKCVEQLFSQVVRISLDHGIITLIEKHSGACLKVYFRILCDSFHQLQDFQAFILIAFPSAKHK